MKSLDMGSSTTGSAYRQGVPSPILYGNLVSSVDHLEDTNGNMGLFFVFPDLSICWRGRFQLGVTLIRISMSEQSFVAPLSISLFFSARPGQCGISEEGKTLAQT